MIDHFVSANVRRCHQSYERDAALSSTREKWYDFESGLVVSGSIWMLLAVKLINRALFNGN